MASAEISMQETGEMAKTWAFRISCRLSGGDFSSWESATTLVLPEVPRPIRVRCRRQSEGWGLFLICGGFKSAEEARQVGYPVRTALILLGIDIAVGIDAGTDQVVSKALSLLSGNSDERLQPDVLGLQVYPDLEGIVFGGLRILGTLRKPDSIPSLASRMPELVAIGLTLTTRQVLSTQLYNAARFQSSESARFLTLISSIEVLIEPANRSLIARQLIEKFVSIADTAGLEQSEKQSLLSGLGNLKNESIGSACRLLVRKYCGNDEAEYFRSAYEVRSRMLHDGETPAEGLLMDIIKLDDIVRHLLIKHLAGRTDSE